MRESLSTPIKLLLAVVITVLHSGTIGAFSANAPADREQMRLWRLIDYDPDLMVIRGGFTSAKLDACLAALRDPDVEVQLAAIQLLREIVRQLDVPQATITGTIRPAMERLLETSTSTERGMEDLRRIARGVLWHGELRGLDNERARLRFLKRTLTLTNFAYYEKLNALDEVAEIAGPEALKLLKSQVIPVGPAHPETHYDRKVQFAIKKVELIRRLADLDASGHAALLKSHIPAERHLRFEELQFASWCVRRLERYGDPASIQVLKAILADKSFDRMVRYEAQEALVYRGELDPASRVVVFIH